MTLLMQPLLCQRISTSAQPKSSVQDFPLPAGCHSIIRHALRSGKGVKLSATGYTQHDVLFRRYCDCNHHAYMSTQTITLRYRETNFSSVPKRKHLSCLLLEYRQYSLWRNFYLICTGSTFWPISHNYHSYRDFVPKCLHGRPHSVIQH